MRDWWRRGALLLSGVALAAAVQAQAPVSDDVWRMARQVRHTVGQQRLPFAIVDKRAAMLVVFQADGQLAGSTSALLGRTYGDDTAPGVGERAQRGALRPGDTTTPAGRFTAQPGVNQSGEEVIWVDMESAFAIHRLRPGPTHAARARRLASADPGKRRVSAGCVVVEVSFFERVVLPVLGRGAAVVYVLPEAGLAAAGTTEALQDM